MERRGNPRGERLPLPPTNDGGAHGLCSEAGDRVRNNHTIDGTWLDSVGTTCSVAPDVLLSILKLEQVLHAVVNCPTLTLSGAGFDCTAMPAITAGDMQAESGHQKDGPGVTLLRPAFK